MVGCRFNPLQFLRVTGTVLPQCLDLLGNLRGRHGAVQVLQLWESGPDHRLGLHPAPGHSCPCPGGSRGGSGLPGRAHSPASMCRQLCCSACSCPERVAISPSSPRSSASLAAGSCSCGERRVRAAGPAGPAGGGGRGSPGQRSRSSASRRPSPALGPAAPAAPAPSPRPAGRAVSRARARPAPARPGPAHRLAQPVLPLQVPEGVLGAVRAVLLLQVPQQDGGGASCGTSPGHRGLLGPQSRPVLPRPSRTHRPPRNRALCSSRGPGPPAPLRSRLAPLTHFRRAAGSRQWRRGRRRTVIGGGDERRPVPEPAPRERAPHTARGGSGLGQGPGRRGRSEPPGGHSPTGTGAPAAGREARPHRPRTGLGQRRGSSPYGITNSVPSSPSRLRPFPRPRPQPRHGRRSRIGRDKEQPVTGSLTRYVLGCTNVIRTGSMA